jgi:hypothetical protein
MPEPIRAGERIASRGYCPTYHPREVNRCPGCGGTHWYVGRVSAECGFCATVLMFAGGGRMAVLDS